MRSAHEPGNPSHARVADIEALRAFAVAFVLALHIPGIGLLLPPVFRHGWVGVDLFFVISGYVVARAFRRDCAARHGSPRAIARFYARRAFRIVPTVAAAVAFWVGGWLWFNDSGAFGRYSPAEVLRQTLAIFLVYANYVEAFAATKIHLYPIWSLNVEEHFYLAFPLFAFFVRSRRARVAVLGAVIGFVAFIHRPFDSEHFWTYLSYATDMRIDQIAAGVLLAELADSGRLDAFAATMRARLRHRPLRAATLGYAMVAALWAMPWLFRDNQIAGLKLGMIISMFMAAGLVFFASLDADAFSGGRPRLRRALSALGARSYAAYLFHVPAYWAMDELIVRFGLYEKFGIFPVGSNAYVVCYLVLFAALVEIVHRGVEKPLIRLGRRLLDRRAAV